jgi:hypothetical protein
MRRILLRSLGAVLALILLPLLTLLLVLFFRPGLILNPENLKWALEKTNVLDDWGWESARMDFDWKLWNHRRIHGEFRDFCLKKKTEGADVDTCLTEISWDFDLHFNFTGAWVETRAPFRVLSPQTAVVLKETPPQEKEDSGPPDLYAYWRQLWSKLVPDMEIKFDKISLTPVSGDKLEFDFSLVKGPESLAAGALGFKLTATPVGLELRGPSRWAIPAKLPTERPVYLRDFLLTARVRRQEIPLTITGALDAIDFAVNSRLALPLASNFDGIPFRRQVLLDTTARLSLAEIKSSLERYAPKPFKQLPAPFNTMKGGIVVEIKQREAQERLKIESVAATRIDMVNTDQVFRMGIEAETLLGLADLRPESVRVNLDLQEVRLQLPRLSRTSPPPQFMPDPRIKNAPFKPKEKSARKEKTEESLDLNLKLVAEGERALHIMNNLLDEAVRLNFDLDVVDGELKTGHVTVLPLRTTIFRRPIRLEHLRVTFNHPTEPVLNATVRFPLPEYKITLKLEGPVSKPRHALSSEPPLPEGDILAVLLFGRPMADLDPEDSTAAARTNQILAQGILSLSVLYFLSGTPVEYVGFDPDSQNVTAQVGLGSRTSLRVGAGERGVNQTGVRRSLGKGWYLDTSVQDTSAASNNNDTRNYGVLIERIIAY